MGGVQLTTRLELLLFSFDPCAYSGFIFITMVTSLEKVLQYYVIEMRIDGRDEDL